MLLCFFALSANMTANLFEQTKEIGVLRAMGMTKTRIKLLYFYEALLLILASCMLGVMIGMVTGYTMILQNAAMIGIPLQFFFPYTQFVVILATALLCAFLATWGTTSSLLKKTISSIFRSS